MSARSAALDGLVKAGLTGGFLARLPGDAAERLASDGIRIDLPASSVVYRDEGLPHAIVVVIGLLRLYMTSAEGRQVTVRYARSGDVLGLAMVLGGPAPVSIQALTDAYVLAVRTETLRSLVASDPVVARVCAEEMAGHLFQAFDEVADQAFLTVHQRVARHLLDLAQPQAGRLAARLSQQQLADAVGSVREVVTRVLAQMRTDRLISTSRDEIVLLDPVRIAGEASGRPEMEA